MQETRSGDWYEALEFMIDGDNWYYSVIKG